MHSSIKYIARMADWKIVTKQLCSGYFEKSAPPETGQCII